MKPPLALQSLCDQYLEKVRNDPQHSLEAADRSAIYQAFGPLLGMKQREIQNGRLILTQADKAFGWLGIITARKVIPIWEAATVEDVDDNEDFSANPNEMLRVAEGVLLGTIDAQIALDRDLCNRFYYGGTGLEKRTTKPVYCANSASYAALESIYSGVEGLNSDFTSRAIMAYAGIDENESGLWWDAQIAQADKNIETWLETETDEDAKGFREAFEALNLKLEALNPEIIEQVEGWMAENKRRAEKFIPIKYDPQKGLEFWQWWLGEAIPQAWDAVE